MTRFRSLFLFLLPFLLCACATATGSFQPLGSNHPANPQAPEVPVTDPSAFLRMDGGEASAMDHSSMSPADTRPPASTGAYVCPMHAEVSSDQPGSCPKCGMKLVPRESTEPTPEEHPHDG